MWASIVVVNVLTSVLLVTLMLSLFSVVCLTLIAIVVNTFVVLVLLPMVICVSDALNVGVLYMTLSGYRTFIPLVRFNFGAEVAFMSVLTTFTVVINGRLRKVRTPILGCIISENASDVLFVSYVY